MRLSILNKMNSPNVNVHYNRKFHITRIIIPSKTSISLAIMFIVCLMLNGDVKPITRRGFFCDDASLNYPYKKETVGMRGLIFVGLILPCILIKICDNILHSRFCNPSRGSLKDSIFGFGKRRKISDDVQVMNVEDEELIVGPSKDDKTSIDENISSSDHDIPDSNSRESKTDDKDSDTDSDESVLLFTSVPLDSDQEEKRIKMANRSRYTKGKGILGRTFSELQLFIFGFCTTMLFTGIGKVTLGRMRPHFMQRCQPNVDCSHEANERKYIEEYTCTNPNLVPRDLSYITTSWPSGHAAIMFYSMLYVIIHLNRVVPVIFQSNKRIVKRKFDPLLLYSIFVLMIGTACYIALTRISDYHHHPFDVFCGTIIGTFTAIWLSKSFSADYLEESY